MKDSEEIDQHMKMLFSLIQKGMQNKELNTAALAQKLGMERKQLKRILNGSAPLTIKDFLHISKLLSLQSELTPEAFQEASQEDSSQEESPSIARLTTEEPTDLWTPQPLGNHTEQLVQLGFALGCNMLLLCQTSMLQSSNVPKEVLKRFQPRIPIQLEAEYHQYNKPQYFPEGLEIRLSFDALYTCFFPWKAIEQVSFFPFIDEDPTSEDPDEQPERPNLRLV